MFLLRVVAVFLPLLAATADDRRVSHHVNKSIVCESGHCCTTEYVKKEVNVNCTERGWKDVPKNLPKDTITLDLQGNKISSIRRNAFVGLTKLESLNLTANKIRWLDPGAFNGLSELKSLKLGENPHIELKSATLAPLRHLQELNLQMIQSLSLDEDVFLRSVSLQHLNASNSRLRDLSFLSSLRNAPNITNIELQGNRLGNLTKDMFDGLVSKRLKLNLGGSGVTHIETGTFASIRKLWWLTLSNNNISSSLPGALLGLHHLRVLSLRNSGLSDLSFLSSLWNSPNITSIELQGNRLGNLTKDMFDGFVSKRLNSLNFRGSGVTHIETGTFASITNMSFLDLSDNNISSSLPGALLGLHHLQVLHLSNVNLRNHTKLQEMWGYLRPNNTSDAALKFLFLSRNGLKRLPVNGFKGLGNLWYLNISQNPLTERASKEAFVGLRNLLKLHMYNCRDLTSFPKFAPENGTQSFTPKLEYLDLSWSPVVTLPKPDVFKGLETLKHLDLSHTFIRGIVLDSLKNIEVLKLNDSCLDELPEVNSSTLTTLNIAYNRFHIARGLKWTVPNLAFLRISGNKFINMTGNDTVRFFSFFPSLKTLVMQSMGLYFIPDALFDKLANLTKLDLSFNDVGGKINNRWFKNLKKLEELYLRDCRLTTINRQSFPDDPDFLRRLKKLDLRYNALTCDCSIEWFYSAILEKSLPLRGKWEEYKCNLKSTQTNYKIPIKDYRIPESCTKAYRLLAGLCAFGVLLIVTFALGLGLFSRYRWYIKYKIFKLRLWFYGSQYEDLDGSEYEYHFLVHYDDSDFPWIRDMLIPELENKRGYRLYIKDRDSRLCEYILENIQYSIENSYKTVLCISNQFTQNSWCQFLLRLLIQKLVNEKKNILVCILLEEIEGENLLDTLENVLTQKNYIRLPEDRSEEAMAYFWTCVVEALHIPVIPHRNNAGPSDEMNMPDDGERQALLHSVC